MLQKRIETQMVGEAVVHTQLQGEERAAWMQSRYGTTEGGKSAASDGVRRPTAGEASQLRQKLGQKVKQEPKSKSPTQSSEPPSDPALFTGRLDSERERSR